MDYLSFIDSYCQMHQVNIQKAVKGNEYRPRVIVKSLYEFLLKRGVDHENALKLMKLNKVDFESFGNLENQMQFKHELYSEKAELRHEIIWLKSLVNYTSLQVQTNILKEGWEDLIKASNNAKNRLRTARAKLANLKNGLPALGYADHIEPIKFNYGSGQIKE